MLYFFKPYKHLPGYIHRFSLLIIGRLHIRVHVLLTPDGTPYIHRHPFSYMSIILKGGYIEQVLTKDNKIEELDHRRGSVIFRHKNKYHRIKELNGRTKTLFVAWSHGDWDLKHHPDIEAPQYFIQPDTHGVYKRYIGDREEYSLFNGVWREGRKSKLDAHKQTKPSIHQVVTRWESD